MNKSSRVELLTGAARTRKATEVRKRYLSLTQSCPPSDVLLLVPTGHRQAATIERLLAEHPDGVLYNHEIWTFPRYAEELLRRLDGAVRRVSHLQRQILLEASLAECRRKGQISYFEPIAGRPGLLELLGGFIHRLKTQEIGPQAFMKSCRQGPASLRETAAVYQAYQRQLESNGLYDNAGLFWQAREQLAAAEERIAWPQHVLVDGFQDFTAPEIELLAMLVSHSASAIITLPCDADRGDIFQDTTRLLERLRLRLGKIATVMVTTAAAPADEHAGTLSLIEQRLFAEDASPLPAAGEDVLQLAEIAGRTQEVEYIARKLKGMLREEGALRPEDIAIILRRSEPYEALIGEIFPRYGLPVVGADATALTRVAVTRWILAMLELPASDYPSADLASVLRSPYLDAALLLSNARTLELGDTILHQHMVLAGRHSHLAGIDRWVRARQDHQRYNDEASGDEHIAGGACFRRALEQFFGLLDALPRKGSHRQMVEGLRQLLERLDLRRRVVALCDASGPALEQLRVELAALDALDEMLAELSQADKWFEQAPAELGLAEFAALLREAMSSASLSSGAGVRSAIRVMNVYDSRALSFKVVVLPGLAQGIWPQGMSSTLLDSEDTQRLLERAGLEIADRTQQMAGEKFLFYMAITRASQRLVVTRPSSDESGRPIACSPFWDELVRLAGADGVLRVSMSALATVRASAANIDELRRACLLDVPDDRAEARCDLAAMLKVDANLEAILSGAAVEHERESFNPFGPYDGIISDKQTLAELEAAYPGSRLYSISRLQDYLTCPYRFLAAHVLGLSAWEQPDPEAMQAPDVGRLYHDILRDFHVAFDAVGEDGNRMSDTTGGAGAHDLIAEISGRHFDRYEHEAGKQLPVLWKLQRDEMFDRLMAYVDAEMLRRAEHPWRPLRLEWGFGMTRHLEDADERSSALPLDLDTAHGTIGFRGRVDRIDESDSGARVAIVDYKSGAGYISARNEIKKGHSLQMPVYLLAVSRLLLGGRPVEAWEASYYYLAAAKYETGVASLGEEGLAALASSLTQTVSSIFGGIRTGYFPPLAANCPGYCDYRELCRSAGWRIARKATAANEAALNSE